MVSVERKVGSCMGLFKTGVARLTGPVHSRDLSPQGLRSPSFSRLRGLTGFRPQISGLEPQASVLRGFSSSAKRVQGPPKLSNRTF